MAKGEASAQLTELSVQSRFDTDNSFNVNLNSDALSFSSDILKRIEKKLNKIDLSEGCPDRLNIKQLEKSLAMHKQSFLEDITLP